MKALSQPMGMAVTQAFRRIYDRRKTMGAEDLDPFKLAEGAEKTGDLLQGKRLTSAAGGEKGRDDILETL
jgi:hypothetical protein